MNDRPVILRPGQQRILQYRSGKMGISAVPGSGKTWTLSQLAARLIQMDELAPDQEILIVTLVNAAVENFSVRISNQLQAAGLLPGLGYRVRTLHGLAHDIVRERPDLAGLGRDFTIIDEVEAGRIKARVAASWLEAHPDFFLDYLDEDLAPHKRSRVLNKDLPDMLESIATAFIRLAKDHQLTPEHLRAHLSRAGVSLPLVEMGTDIYTDYQSALNYRGSVDFDDLIRLALRCLKSDPDLAALLRQRWPFILEDEAQDSSLLQQEILTLLTGDTGNWVRVGDPNQAIYETFTTANPQYLLDFIQRSDVFDRTLPESGRSTHSIIQLANHLITWTQEEHFNPEARRALTPPLIQPTPEGDPQPNPPDCPDCIRFIEREMTPEEEVETVVDAVQDWLAEHPDKTVAILSPRNYRGFKFVDALKERDIPCVDSLLQSTESTRLSTGAIANILKYLSDPQSSRKLATAYKVWRRAEREDDEQWPFCKAIAGIIRDCEQVEDYLWPTGADAWMEDIHRQYEAPEVYDELLAFREVVRRWQATVFLPIDQLVLTLSQDLFLDPVELALAHKLSTLLRQFSNAHPDWRLPELTEELALVARNQRRFLGFSDEDTAFNPDLYPGQVVVATMHKAKGLEWDAVFLTSLNNYNFPSGNEYDQYQPEKWFLRGRMNMEAEIIAQMKTLIEDNPLDWYQPGKASEDARQDFIRERLRLFYVGITRARIWLTATWNTGRFGNSVASIPFLELLNNLERTS